MRALDRKLLRDLAAHVGAVARHRAGHGLRRRHADPGRRHLSLARGDARAPTTSATASATSSPRRCGRRRRSRATIAAIDGVAAVETRIVEPVLLDIEGMREPATGDRDLAAAGQRHRRQRALPPRGPAARGRRGPTRSRSTPISPRRTASASARRSSAIIGGAKIELTIVGIVLSPEYVYAIGPGDMMPDNRRFGVIWMPEDDARVALRPRRRVQFGQPAAAARAPTRRRSSSGSTRSSKPYGGIGAYGRKDQLSNAFLDGELTQLAAWRRSSRRSSCSSRPS